MIILLSWFLFTCLADFLFFTVFVGFRYGADTVRSVQEHIEALAENRCFFRLLLILIGDTLHFCILFFLLVLVLRDFIRVLGLLFLGNFLLFFFNARLVTAGMHILRFVLVELRVRLLIVDDVFVLWCHFKVLLQVVRFVDWLCVALCRLDRLQLFVLLPLLLLGHLLKEVLLVDKCITVVVLWLNVMMDFMDFGVIVVSVKLFIVTSIFFLVGKIKSVVFFLLRHIFVLLFIDLDKFFFILLIINRERLDLHLITLLFFNCSQLSLGLATALSFRLLSC